MHELDDKMNRLDHKMRHLDDKMHDFDGVEVVHLAVELPSRAVNGLFWVVNVPAWHVKTASMVAGAGVFLEFAAAAVVQAIGRAEVQMN